MDAHQLLANGLDQKRCYHRRIHTAGKSQQDLLIPHLGANCGHLLFDKGICQSLGGDPLHILGTNIVGHIVSSIYLKFIAPLYIHFFHSAIKKCR